MIEYVVIKNYRLFEVLEFEPRPGMNIIAGDNESGKSTLLEAISLALSGRVNGRWAQDELNPYWFNQARVREYFEKLGKVDEIEKPEITIELYLTNDIDGLQHMRGVYNSRQEDCPGVSLRVFPSRDYAVEFAQYIADGTRPDVLPVEYYEVEWNDFADQRLRRRPKGLGLSVIDSRTVRSTSGIDYHTREMLSDFIEPKERAAISVAHRSARHSITETTLAEVNARIADEVADLHDRQVGLQMDQSSNSSWESGIVPAVSAVPFAMAGQGQQAAVKIALAMRRQANSTAYVLIEEPENHLSHTSLTKLVARIDQLSAGRQVFLTTHSSFVLNRLGLNRLALIHEGAIAAFAELSEETEAFFKKLSGYDTLRLVLAQSVVLVEGPSDEMVFSRAFYDRCGVWPADRGVDVISVGTTIARSLQLGAALQRKMAALRDNDGKDPSHWETPLADSLLAGERVVFIGDPQHGSTLEPQIITANGPERMRAVLKLDPGKDVAEWMASNKTEGALRIMEFEEPIQYPNYIMAAVEFIR